LRRRKKSHHCKSCKERGRFGHHPSAEKEEEGFLCDGRANGNPRPSQKKLENCFGRRDQRLEHKKMGEKITIRNEIFEQEESHNFRVCQKGASMKQDPKERGR